MTWCKYGKKRLLKEFRNTGSCDSYQHKVKSAQSTQRKTNIFAVLCEILCALCLNGIFYRRDLTL
jgi:hypothetical protein